MTNDLVDHLINLHIAEYSALTNRNTYYISISFTVWPSLVLYLSLIGLIVRQWNVGLMAGLAVVGSELLAIGWYYCLWENYKNACYLEAKLRQEVASLLRSGSPETPDLPAFWDYERSNDLEKGPSWVRFIGDWWAAIFVLGIGITLFISYRNSPGASISLWMLAAFFALALFVAGINQMAIRK